MKTTVEVPDDLYREIKARAALRGQSVKVFFLEALRDKLSADRRPPAEAPSGWRSAFGSADPAATADVQRIIDEEFSAIDPKDWQ